MMKGERKPREAVTSLYLMPTMRGDTIIYTSPLDSLNHPVMRVGSPVQTSQLQLKP